jgi:hypothetical protein
MSDSDPSPTLHLKRTADVLIDIHRVLYGNIIGPQLFFEREAPSYPSGFLGMMICFGIAFALCCVLRINLIQAGEQETRS